MSHHLHPEAALALARQRSTEIRAGVRPGPRNSYPRRWRPKTRGERQFGSLGVARRNLLAFRQPT